MASPPDGQARVSVVIPAYRVTSYVAQAVESALAQTHPAHEVIVVNDECPDTPALEEVLAPFMDRILYLRRPNGGPGAARNTGIAAASGELIAFLDADDYWAPEFLESQLQALAGYDMVYCDAMFIDGAGRPLRRFMQGSPSTGEPDLAALLAGYCSVVTSTVVARKSCLEAAGLFDEEIGNYSEDFDLWCRVAHSPARIDYHTGVLAYHRVHGDSLTAVPLALPQGSLRVLDKIRHTLELTVEERAALDSLRRSIAADMHAQAAKEALRRHDAREAVAELRQSVALKPTLKRRAILFLLRLAPRVVGRLYARRGSSRTGA